MLKDIQQEILRLKKERDFCILAHSYITPDIAEIADYTGDSYKLSTAARGTSNKNVLLCGVRFMAESVKLLSPEKRVYLANPSASCPMAEQLSDTDIIKLKSEYPGYSVAAYINTTASLKAVCDVCVTSSSALKIIDRLENDNILFIPDKNLGGYIKSKVKNKNIVLLDGGCPVHSSTNADDVKKAREKHPDSLLLVHPECPREVVDEADFVGSTAEIMSFAKSSEHTEFIIGTEISIIQHLELMCADKRFYPLSKKLICPDMKITTLTDVLNTLKGVSGEEIKLSDGLINNAVKSINEMVRLSED